MSLRFPPLLFFYLVLASTLSWAADPAEIGPFGIGSSHTRTRSAQDNATWIPQMEKIGLHYLRSGATGWGQVQPAEDRFDFSKLDAQMDYLSQNGFTYGGILMGVPKWNMLVQTRNLPVNDLPGWSRYVKEIVGHTRGRIARWEVWNEPPNFTGKDQTPEDYSKTVVAAFDAAKKANPECLVGLAAKSAHINYLQQVIEAGAKGHYDYITLHPYEILNGVAENAGTEPVFMNILPVLRKMLAIHDPAKVNVPVIFTELGSHVDRTGADTQAYALVKGYTMGIAQGVACIHWFEGRDGDSGPMGLLDAQGLPRPAYTAMAQMIQHLGQDPKYLGWVLLDEKHYAFAFQGAQGPVLITWAYRGQSSEVNFDAATQIVDPLTGAVQTAEKTTLSQAPILVLQPPEKLLQLARSHKGQPLPWGGDYTKVPSVSLTWGSEPVEAGLHSLSGESLGKAVVAYGGSARAGSVPGGNLFVVDPGFLSYTTGPIEITVVVRRNEANENAGFKLSYESTTGLKNSPRGWYTVPDDKGWHTVKWQIDDAQFNNYWGYNFALNSDGKKFANYYLQSVTVTKLRK